MFSISKRIYIYIFAFWTWTVLLSKCKWNTAFSGSGQQPRTLSSLHNCKMIRIWMNGKFMCMHRELNTKNESTRTTKKKNRLKTPKKQIPKHSKQYCSGFTPLPAVAVLIFDFCSFSFGYSHRLTRIARSSETIFSLWFSVVVVFFCPRFSVASFELRARISCR